jgi:hypothetical protein
LGFIIFDFMLVMFAPFFSTPVSTAGAVENNPEITKYKNVSSFGDLILALLGNGVVVAIVAAVLGTGLLAKWLSGGSINTMLLIGIGLFIAMVTILWSAASLAIANINPYNDSNIATFITVITICIGLLLMFSIVELFTGQQGVD